MCPPRGLAIGQEQRAGDRDADLDQLEVAGDRPAERERPTMLTADMMPTPATTTAAAIGEQDR